MQSTVSFAIVLIIMFIWIKYPSMNKYFNAYLKAYWSTIIGILAFEEFGINNILNYNLIFSSIFGLLGGAVAFYLIFTHPMFKDNKN